MSGAGRSFGNARLHVGTDGSAHCWTYDGAVPILTVDAGPSSVTLTLADRPVPGEQGVAFARELAAAAAVFAAECERLHAASVAAAGDGDAAGQAA